jgi:hypothetical protein
LLIAAKEHAFLARVNVSAAYPWWPVFRCPSVAGFGCPPRVGDELHLFYRDRHHQDFVYYGQLDVIDFRRFHGRPSRFTFGVRAGNES